jgi:hypothetical protein
MVAKECDADGFLKYFLFKNILKLKKKINKL